MKKEQSEISKRADDCRFLADDLCRETNELAGEGAVAAFEKLETACFFRENAKYAIGLVVNRTEDLRDGRPLFPLPVTDEGMLVRLLSSQTEVDYEISDYDKGLSDEETIEAWKRGDLVQEGYMSSATTPTTDLQCAFFEALADYVRTAAICAKRWQSATLMDWVSMIDILESRPRYLVLPLSENDAERLFTLERSAANRLRLDRIAAELPSRIPVKGAKKGKAR